MSLSTGYHSGEQSEKQKAIKSLKAKDCPGCEKDCNNCEAKYLAYQKKD